MWKRVIVFTALIAVLLSCTAVKEAAQDAAEEDIAQDIPGEDPGDPFIDETPAAECSDHCTSLAIFAANKAAIFEGNTTDGTVVPLQGDLTLTGRVLLEVRNPDTFVDAGDTQEARDKVALEGTIAYSGDKKVYEGYSWTGVVQDYFDDEEVCTVGRTLKGVVLPDPEVEDDREYRIDGAFTEDGMVFVGILQVEFGGKIVDLAELNLPQTLAW